VEHGIVDLSDIAQTNDRFMLRCQQLLLQAGIGRPVLLRGGSGQGAVHPPL
jgi:hypothetical protein